MDCSLQRNFDQNTRIVRDRAKNPFSLQQVSGQIRYAFVRLSKVVICANGYKPKLELELYYRAEQCSELTGIPSRSHCGKACYGKADSYSRIFPPFGALKGIEDIASKPAFMIVRFQKTRDVLDSINVIRITDIYRLFQLLDAISLTSSPNLGNNLMVTPEVIFVDSLYLILAPLVGGKSDEGMSMVPFYPVR